VASNTADMLLHLHFRNDASSELKRATKELAALNAATTGSRPSAADATRMAQLERQTVRSYSQVSKLGNELKSLGDKMSLFVTAPILAFFYQSTQAASDMAEQVNKARVVFGQFYSDISRQAATAPKNLLISPRQYLNYVGTFGAFLSGSMNQSANAKTSAKLVSIGADLASFYNTTTDDSLAAIQSGLVGQIRPLRRFGINLSADAVAAQAKSDGTWSGTGPLSDSVKVSARVAVIAKQAALANGDVARTASSAANQQKRLRAEFSDLQVTVGQGLLPVWVDLLHVGIGITSVFNALPGPLRAGVIGFALLAAAAGPVISAFGRIMNMKNALVARNMFSGLGSLFAGGGGAAAATSYPFNYAPGSLALGGLAASGPTMAVGAGRAAAGAEAAGGGLLGVLAIPAIAAAGAYAAYRYMVKRDQDKTKAAARSVVAAGYSGTNQQSIKSLESATKRIKDEQDQKLAEIAAQPGKKGSDALDARQKRNNLIKKDKADYKALGDQLATYGQQLSILRQQEQQADDEMGYTAAIKERITAMDELEKKTTGAANGLKGFNNIMSYNASKRSDFATIMQDRENVAKYGQQWWGTVPGLDARDALISSAQDRALKAASLPEGAPGKIQPNQVAQFTETWARANLDQVGLSIDTSDLKAALDELQAVEYDVILHPIVDTTNMPGGWHPTYADWVISNNQERKTTSGPQANFR